MFLRILGILGTLGFGAFAIQLWLFPDPEVSIKNTIAFRGELSSVDHIARSEGGTLQLWLTGNPTPFRSSAGFPDSYRSDYMLHLDEGIEMEVFIEEGEYGRTRKDYSMDQEFIPICGLNAEGVALLKFEDFNAWRRNNTTIGRILTPILTVGSIYLMLVGFGFELISYILGSRRRRRVSVAEATVPMSVAPKVDLADAALFRSKFWWLNHLGECADSGAEDEDSRETAHVGFGASESEATQFWKESLNLDSEHGPWPQFTFSVGRHSLSIVYFGPPRHEVEYRHSADDGVSEAWCCDGAHSTCPGFRWKEILQFARLSPHSEPALLLLLPAVDIEEDEADEAAHEIGRAFASLGIYDPSMARYISDLVSGLSYGGRWWRDEKWGWITDIRGSYRCRQRLEEGLAIPRQESFLRLKALIDFLEAASPEESRHEKNT